MSRRAVAVLALALLLILGISIDRLGGPAAKPRTAPASQFSAERAIDVLHQVVGQEAPRPIGTAAHEATRERIINHLRSLGYEVDVQHTAACNPFAFCAPLSNVIARLPGQSSGKAVLLAAHYDSVGAGPGISDDGIGVAAILEVARAIRTEHFRNPIVILIDDGEEAGLLGAEGFVADAARSADIAAVINIEARGSSGASYLFETSRNNKRLIALANSLPRPATSSLFYSIYELMPNDTDMTVFKRAGKQGVNFACIGNVGSYHTPRDDFAHVTPSTVQHHGENVLAMTRAFGNADLEQIVEGNATYFDLLGIAVVHWPEWGTTLLAILAAAMLIVAAALRVREGETRVSAIALGLASFVLSLIVALVLALIAAKIVGLRTQGMKWVAYPVPIVAAMWLIGIASAIAIASLFKRKAGFDGLFIGHGLGWSALGFVLVFYLSGGAYMLVLPALAFALCALARATFDLSDGTSAVTCAVIAGVLHFGLALTFYTALGAPVLPGIAAILALIATTFSPLVAGDRRITTAMFAIAAVCVIAALLLPPFTATHPRRGSINYVSTDSESYWETTIPLPGVPSKLRTLYEWYLGGVDALVSPAPRLPLPSPEVRVVSDERKGKRTLTLDLHSNRNAQRVALAFHSDATIDAIRVNGVAPPPLSPRDRPIFAPGWQRVSFRASDARVEITIRGVKAIDAVVMDATFGLPPEGAAIARARDTASAVQTDEGDVTVVMRRLRL